MFNDWKRAALKINDPKFWPVFSEGDPVLESSEDAIAYGNLIWPDDYLRKKLSIIEKKEVRKSNQLKKLGDITLDQRTRIAVYVQFLHEAAAEFKRIWKTVGVLK
ncbi:hypothetical protein LCGC14_1816070 [marine sediment metagenome]|uniref:Uncharacterized protein n=1 Tax=marine sediment metagenome TaxID=412755 RepID=A0A0F9H8H2_9ZZZZ